MADLGIIMLTLPDWLTGVLLSGSLAYVLLPQWAHQSVAQQSQTQTRVTRWLLAGAAFAMVALYLLRASVANRLVSGLPTDLTGHGELAIAWAAVALPAAMLAALWVTRLQHAQDFIGMYAANLVINGVLILGYYLAARAGQRFDTLHVLGVFLGLAMGLRLLWLHWRLRVCQPAPESAGSDTPPVLPGLSVWLWAALASGLPLTLPFAARSLASGGGAGALATFNYAWKLVELPLVLAVQLIASLAFPAITQAMAGTQPTALSPGVAPRLTPAIGAIRSAFLLAWTVACAATAAIQVGAPTIVAILFGWGRMPQEGLGQVAHWGRIGAWSLLPQALISVGLTVLASQGRMRTAVMTYALALALLLVWGSWSTGGGADLMAAISTVLGAVAAALLLDIGVSIARERKTLEWLPWQEMAIPALTMLGWAFAAQQHWMAFSTPEPVGTFGALWCLAAGASVLGVTFLSSSALRAALRR